MSFIFEGFIYSIYTQASTNPHFFTKFAKFDRKRPFCDKNFSIQTIIHVWKILILKKKLVQPSKHTNHEHFCTRKQVEEKQPHMAHVCCSPSTQFTGKYNNNICTRKHVKNIIHTIY